jgi:hypothetical protein
MGGACEREEEVVVPVVVSGPFSLMVRGSNETLDNETARDCKAYT